MVGKTDPASLQVNPKTGLVPIEFLGVPHNGKAGTVRAGEAGLGLRVGEVRGVSPDVAASMIDAGTAKALPPVDDDGKPFAKGKAAA